MIQIFRILCYNNYDVDMIKIIIWIICTFFSQLKIITCCHKHFSYNNNVIIIVHGIFCTIIYHTYMYNYKIFFLR